ncbi:MAG: MFS transporter [Candidatus Lokiarchaeota archaeon]|nr:MFS transporter [Candidatus Lokiarchaeota archaeon]MBD3201389.1 MFS transporter [Candidatus Lokiarchaeota archaeon]
MISKLNETEKEPISKAVKIPILVFLTFAFGDFIIELFVYLFSVRVFHFYETVVLLNPLLILFAYVLYAGYNMINDPIVGYLADRPRSFWQKIGKRTPWIFVGGIGLAISFILIFSVPNIDPVANSLIIFFWLLISVCLFDTFFSMFDTNYNGLIPEKFRRDENRLRLSGFEVFMGILGQIVGSIIAPLIIDTELQTSYIIMALVMAIIAIIIIILQLYGIREDDTMKERYLRNTDNIRKKSFLEMLKICVTQRSFLAYLLLFTCYQATILLLLGSIPYMVEFVLLEEADMETVIMIGYIFAGLLSVPLWSRLAKKKGNKQIYVITGILTSLLTIPFWFVDSVTFGIISAALLGIGLIGFWLMSNPILADVIDEAVAKNEVRQEGLYMGVRVFFARIALIIQAVTFTVIHILTGFDPEATTQSGLAIIGLRMQMALVPMILMLLGILIFYLLYDITPEKKKRTKLRLEQLKL